MDKAIDEAVPLELSDCVGIPEVVEIKPGAFFLGRSTWDCDGGLNHIYQAVYVYEVFEKRLKSSTSIHCRYFEICWYLYHSDRENVQSSISDREGLVDGMLYHSIEDIMHHWLYDEDDKRSTKHEFSINNPQDLKLVVQSGKTVRQIITDTFDKRCTDLKKERALIAKRLKRYDSVKALLKEL